MTKQEFLDDLYEASTTGQFPGWNPDSHSCVLRGPDGRRCAWGRCIPDSFYSPEMEGYGVIADFFKKYPELGEACLPEGISQKEMQEIQFKHDNTADIHAGGWNHDTFWMQLMETQIFKGMVPKQLAG